MAALNILVIGLGYFGESVAVELAKLGHDVIGADKNPEVVQRTAAVLSDAVQLDATNLEALKTLDISSFDICVVGRGGNLEESVLIAMNLKELGARNIVSKAVTAQQCKILERIGANQVVLPERDMGKRVAHMVAMTTEMLDYMDIPGDYGIQEIAVPRGWTDHTLSDLQLPTRYGVQVLLIKSGEKFTASPGSSALLHDGDILVVFGHNRRLAQFKR